MSKLPEELQIIVENLSPFQRKYCEYRAKGLVQSLAAEKAGSIGKDRTAKGRIGYQVEALPGVKDYILWLQQERAKVAMIDDVEIIDKLRKVYEEAMSDSKYSAANDAVRLMGMLIGKFYAKAPQTDTLKVEQELTTNNNTNAFQEDTEDNTPNEVDQRLEKLQQMIKDINK